MGKRKRYDSRFKAQVALEAIRNRQTISQIASQYSVHPNRVSKWKRRAPEGLVELFSDGKGAKQKDQQRLIDELCRQIGQLKVELDRNANRMLVLRSAGYNGTFDRVFKRYVQKRRCFSRENATKM